MEIMESSHARIQKFLNRAVTEVVYERGRDYFLDGRVKAMRFIDEINEIEFNVFGSDIYDVDMCLDLDEEEIFVSWNCDCPAFLDDTCKHVAASAFWIQSNWNIVAQQFGWEHLIETKSSGKKSTKVKKVNRDEYWELKNFPALTVNKLNASFRMRPWHPMQLQSIHLDREGKGLFKAVLGYSAAFSDRIDEQFVLNVESDNTNLRVKCNCRDKGAQLCHHAISFFEVLIDEGKMDLFIELSPEQLNEQGREALRKYGLNPDANWEDYFSPSIRNGQKSLLPKESMANLISPGTWSPGSTDAIFKGNPEQDLEIVTGHESQKTYELGFYFHFYSYADNDFSFVPLVARESKKGVPMSVSFKDMNSVNYPDYISKRSDDIPLLTLSSSFESGFKPVDSDDKLAYFTRYVNAIADHPYIFLNTGKNGYQLRKADILPIQFHPQPPRLKYVLTENGDFISIHIYFQIFGKDISINDKAMKSVHPHFLNASDHLFFIPNEQDTRHFEHAKELDGKIISVKMLPELFEKYLNHALRKSDIEFKNFKSYNVKNQTLNAVSKEIYLSEVGNFVLFRPFIRYENDYLMDALSQESQWEVSDKGILKTEQDSAMAEEFRAELRAMHPAFKDQFNRTDYLHIAYNELLRDNRFLDIFEDFEKNGYKVFGLRDLKGLKVNPYPGKVIYSVKSGMDWFEVDAKIVFGDQEVSIEQLKKRFKPGSDYIELSNGSRGMIPKEWIKKLQRLFQHGEVKDKKFVVSNKKFNIVDELFDELDEATTDLIRDKREKLLSFDKMQKYPLPKGIKGTLRHYQEDGFQWLCFLDEFSWGGILADDMGLGKTLQIITFLKHVLSKNKQTNLIVVPTSLLFNWENEIEKFAPSLKVHFYYGSQRIRSTEPFDKYDIVFTSYGHALSDVAILKEYDFNYVILDESQAIKNPASKRFKAVRLLKANNRIAMTGTPIENNTFDLYAQMSFLNPGFLGSAKGFKADFAKAIDNDRDEIKAAELQRLIKPFVLRRTKSQVATELPDKTEEVLYCEMDKSQQKVYDAFRNEYRQRLIEKIDEEGMNKARFAVLEGLTKLRQICDTPEILPGEDKYSGKSVKTDLLMMHIKEKTANHKILIFSQFVKMLRVIEDRIKTEGISYEYLDGQSSTQQRQASVEHFQNDDSCRVFLISLKAGGTGLNLMAADYVYLVDPWWNPAVENQAIDRCYRIGQDKKVIAYRMICKDTVEEKIMELQKKKKSIAGDIVTTDEGVLKKLKKEDLIGLFG